MIPITQMFLTNKVANSRKKLIKLKGITMHWTANTRKGANALANRNFFNTVRPGNNTSAHYIVDDKSIIQCIKDDEVAYHVGATKYTQTGNIIREGKTPNYFLIGIEMCVNEGGDWNKTYKNSVELAAQILKKYGLGIDNLYRHYDITGKDCPKMMIDKNAWEKFQTNVSIAAGFKKVEVNRLTVMLKRGMNNMNVKTLQQLLNKHGYKLIVDGDFGMITEGTVKDFQRTKGLDADGVVGTKTWDKLYYV